MPVFPIDGLKPRKTPRQARSAVTVDAIFEGVVQVLLSHGASGLTTTLVAERAGVSVGTMYQYFPHKQSLLFAVLKLHLEEVVDAVEDACIRFNGAALREMSDALTVAYVEAKLRHLPGSRALYGVAAELDSAALIDGVVQRLHGAVETMLASASDATFEDVTAVTFALRSLLIGTVRAVAENDASPSSLAMLRAQLPVMARSYLSAVARGVPSKEA